MHERACERRSKPFRSRGFGYFDLDPKKKVIPQTLFFASGTTKVLTTAAAAKPARSNVSTYADSSWEMKPANPIPKDFVLGRSEVLNCRLKRALEELAWFG